MRVKAITLAMADRFDGKIAALAKRQRGYITRRQLLELGVGRESINRRLRSCQLIRVYTGVYAVGHEPTLPHDRAFAALLASGPDSAMSHGSAASAWRVFRGWQMPFEVTAPSVHRRRGIRVHRAALAPQDIKRCLGLRVTSPARTLLDIAPRVREKTLRRALNDLRLAGHLRLEDFAELLSRCPRHPGAKRLRSFIQAPNGPTRSAFEDAFMAFTGRFGLPRPQMNVKINGIEVDAFFPVERVIVELDGYEFHADRGTFRSDRDRDADMLAVDLPTLRVTWDRLTETPVREAERLHAILRGRRKFLQDSQTPRG